MIKVWRMKHYTFHDFGKCSAGNLEDRFSTPDYTSVMPSIKNDTKHHIEEFVMRILDPMWDAWDKYCGYKRLDRCGIGIGAAYIRKDATENLSQIYESYSSGYCAEIYPLNNNFEEFVTFLEQFLKNDRIRFDKIVIQDGFCNLNFKGKGAKQCKIFVYNTKKI